MKSYTKRGTYSDKGKIGRKPKPLFTTDFFFEYDYRKIINHGFIKTILSVCHVQPKIGFFT